MKNKYIIGVFIITTFLGLMGYLFTQSSIKYEDNFQVIKSTNKTVKATGSWVKEKSYFYDAENNLFQFHIRDQNGNEMKVIYSGAIPNNFESATSVVVTGSFKENYFYAKEILTKCPSKYQDLPINKSQL